MECIERHTDKVQDSHSADYNANKAYDFKNDKLNISNNTTETPFPHFQKKNSNSEKFAAQSLFVSQ